MSLWQCLLIPEYRSKMLLSALVNFVQIFTGLMAITNYSTSIIEVRQFRTSIDLEFRHFSRGLLKEKN